MDFSRDEEFGHCKDINQCDQIQPRDSQCKPSKNRLPNLRPSSYQLVIESVVREEDGPIPDPDGTEDPSPLSTQKVAWVELEVRVRDSLHD